MLKLEEILLWKFIQFFTSLTKLIELEENKTHNSVELVLFYIFFTIE